MLQQKPIKWKLVTKKVSELKSYSKNPRNITEQGLKDLKKSVDKFGLAEPIVINLDLTIIGGHGRVLTLKANGTKECDCYIPNRKLNDKEVEELNIRLNKNIAGKFDFDVLANEFVIEDLLQWGFENWEFGILNEKINADEEYIGMPEFDQEGVKFYKLLTIRFITEQDYTDFSKLIKQKLTPETKSIWIPKQNLDSNNNGKAYKA